MYSPVHRGMYIQQGKGFGSIFASLFRVLKPLVSKGMSTAVKGGRRALADKDVQGALSSIKKSALQGGARKFGKLVNPAKQKKQMKTAQKRVITAANLKRKKAKTIFD